MLQLNGQVDTVTVGRSRYRQRRSHRRSDADLELDFNGAAALSDKSLNLAETETRTLPNQPRREIGVERLAKHFVRHPLPFAIRFRYPRR
jgi:hypothetical protein